MSEGTAEQYLEMFLSEQIMPKEWYRILNERSDVKELNSINDVKEIHSKIVNELDKIINNNNLYEHSLKFFQNWPSIKRFVYIFNFKNRQCFFKF